MTLRDPKSIIIISCFVVAQSFIIYGSFQKNKEDVSATRPTSLAPDFTEIENLNYFHLKAGLPQMSLAANTMRSFEDESLEFERPIGVYNLEEKKKAVKYNALEGTYKKKAQLLTLVGEVKLSTDEAQYFADNLKYFLQKDLVLGKGNVKFEGEDLKTKDLLLVTSQNMRARPEAKLTKFEGEVKGSLQRKKKYEGKMDFKSQTLNLDGNKSLAHLEGDVRMKRDSYDITAGKADMYLENFNKSLKYFVLNDDVKVTEKLQTKEGVQQRRAFAERLEGFGREQKMVLTGAPRVEMGKDVIKGYRITIRENVDLIEVDDAMSDVEVKRKD